MPTQHKKRISISLIALGGISLMVSFLSSILPFVGIGILFFAVGGIIYTKTNKKSFQSTFSRFILTVLVFSTAIFALGCTIKAPMAPNVGRIEVKEKLPVEVGLLITEETKNYIFRGKPESFTASGRPHEFPLGDALEKASTQTFLQVFEKVHLVRTSQEARKYEMYLEPTIEDFHFRYDQLSYGGFAIAVISKIKVHVTLGSGETKVWEKSVESPEQKKGPWFFNPSSKKEVGESASDGLVYALRKIALEISEDISIRQFIEKQ